MGSRSQPVALYGAPYSFGQLAWFRVIARAWTSGCWKTSRCRLNPYGTTMNPAELRAEDSKDKLGGGAY